MGTPNVLESKPEPAPPTEAELAELQELIRQADADALEAVPATASADVDSLHHDEGGQCATQGRASIHTARDTTSDVATADVDPVLWGTTGTPSVARERGVSDGSEGAAEAVAAVAAFVSADQSNRESGTSHSTELSEGAAEAVAAVAAFVAADPATRERGISDGTESSEGVAQAVAAVGALVVAEQTETREPQQHAEAPLYQQMSVAAVAAPQRISADLTLQPLMTVLAESARSLPGRQMKFAYSSTLRALAVVDATNKLTLRRADDLDVRPLLTHQLNAEQLEPQTIKLTLEKPAKDTVVGLSLLRHTDLGKIDVVREGSLAANAGFQEGDTVVSINGKMSRSTADAASDLLAAVGRVEVGVVRMRDQTARDVCCVGVAWDPTETILAVAARGVGVKVFANLSGRPIPTLLALTNHLKSEAYGEPTLQRWSSSGQLAVGVADGSFAVFDSRSGKSYGTPRGTSGQHHAAITAAAWMPSTRAPALALGSTSTIKVPRTEPLCATLAY